MSKGKKVNGIMFEKGNKAAEKWTLERAMTFGQDMIKWLVDADENIFFEEYILLIAAQMPQYEDVSVSRKTTSYLANKYPSFANLLENAKNIQELKLKKFGSFDKLNASIVKFLLSAEHGLSEKSEMKTTNTTTVINLGSGEEMPKEKKK